MSPRFAAVLALAALALAGCADYPEHVVQTDLHDPALHGTWVADRQEHQDRIRITFQWNGEFEVDMKGDPRPEVVGTWEASDGTLTLYEADWQMPCGRIQGTYRYTTTTDRISFLKVEDACPVRAAELSKDWYRESGALSPHDDFGVDYEGFFRK